MLPVYLFDKAEFFADFLEHVVLQGMVKAFITYQEPKNNRIFVSFSPPSWFQKKSFMDNFKRTINEARVENWFDPEAKGEAISPKCLQASTTDTGASTFRVKTCSRQKTIGKELLRSAQPIQKVWITPATRWIQKPPTPEPATAVFVPQPVHPSSPIPVVVALPTPVAVSQPEPEMLFPPASVVVYAPAPVAIFPTAPVAISPPAPVVVAPPALSEPTLTLDQTYDELIDAVFVPVSIRLTDLYQQRRLMLLLK
ncbi:hypothetical protein NPIL_183141 [Nephila pilipes]|uniref:Uncharacterized protein n=1 Tax=Nephila pilipes TaxID=299642 RepID=A0A8X6PYJ4_NEPPI|nr:hypothetical protein NPIL_183141 [Nephila pilipes]